MDSVYRIEGNIAHASSWAAGPWSPDMQHSGAPASLVSWVAENIPTRDPMRVARITIDLLRPVPVAPLEIQSEVIREGRKIQLCAITLRAAGVEVVRASVLKIRADAAPLPEHLGESRIDLPGPTPARRRHNCWATEEAMRSSRGWHCESCEAGSGSPGQARHGSGLSVRSWRVSPSRH